MATMTIRTTVAFDPATAQRLERLAKRWGLSKSETLRRALEAAERDLAIDVKTKSDFSKMTPGQALPWLHSHPTLLQEPAIGGAGRFENNVWRMRFANEAAVEQTDDSYRYEPADRKHRSNARARQPLAAFPPLPRIRGRGRSASRMAAECVVANQGWMFMNGVTVWDGRTGRNGPTTDEVNASLDE